MSFQTIHSFLERFRGLKSPHRAVCEALAVAIFDSTGVRVAPSSIILRDEVAFVRLLPAARSEVRVSRQDIFSRVEERTGVRLRDIQ